ncbi:MAG: winged helix-turn-helix domain-containing protein [Thermoplasmata archaeon]|nr:winged helix-turn-helix domain-containing protein [Thermoplasmata archaeon]
MNRLLWWILAGTKGGPNRARIIELLHERPLNANQIAEKLGMDYKTVRHHLSVLAENDIIVTTADGKYGAMYFLSSQIEHNYAEFEQIREQIGKK